MAQPLARFVVVFTTLLFLPTGIAAQCKECGARTAEQRKKKTRSDRRDDPPKTGHPQLSSGRILGSLVNFRHGKSVQELLRLQWSYPADASATPLTPKQALARLNGKNDRKPLLVVRTCATCGGASHPVLDRKDNDETRLLCRWFHLVKVPAAAATKGHALHALFPTGSEHAFASHWTGAGRIELGHQLTPGKLHKALRLLIEQSNKKKPARSVRSLLGSLGKLDKLDEALVESERQFERESTKPNPSKSKLTNLRARINKTTKDRERMLARIAGLSDLESLAIPRVK